MLNKLSSFVDENLRAIRASVVIVGVIGGGLLIKRLHLFQIYRRASDIPQDFIGKPITLHARVKDLHQTTLKVQHLPVLWSSRIKQDDECFGLSITGVEAREGFNTYLGERINNNPFVQFTVVDVTKETVHALVYHKKSRFSTMECLNESLVEQGVAVTSPSANDTLINKLIMLESKAERQGRGVWRKPPFKQRALDFFRWKK